MLLKGSNFHRRGDHPQVKNNTNRGMTYNSNNKIFSSHEGALTCITLLSTYY